MFTNKEIEFLKIYYPTEGRRYCAEKLNKSYTAIARMTRKIGLRILPGVRSKIVSRTRIRGPKIKPSNQYKVNPDAFMKINSKEVAYILGLLWADGFVANHDKPQEIRLKCLKDDIVVFSKTFIKTGDWKIKYYTKVAENRRPTGQIRTCNRPLAQFLVSHNYGPHNINSADSIIRTIPSHLRQYWFRGLVDGDGCWYINKNRYAYEFVLAGCYDQDWTYFEDLLQQLGIKYEVRRKAVTSPEGRQHRNSVVRIRKRRDFIKLGNYVYSGYEKDKIGLKRKYDKYMLAKVVRPVQKGRNSKGQFVSKYDLSR